MSKNYKIISKKNEENPDKTSLVIQGDLVLANINNIKKDLEGIKNKNKDIHIKVTQVSSIDLSFIQVIESFKKSLSEDKVSVIVEYELNEENKNILKDNGFLCN